MKKKITAYEIALSALACALATISLTVGVLSGVLLLTGYLIATLSMMLPLAKGSYRGYALAYVATCLLSVLFNAAQFWDVLPFLMFFGLHPLVNELQLKIKINRWLACAVKALWFDVTVYLVWRLVFAMATPVGYEWLAKYMIYFIVAIGTAFFVVYDYFMYKWRGTLNGLVARITKNKK